jgi:integrase
MRGTVRKRGGTWSYIVYLGTDPATGRTRQREKGGFTTKRAASAALAEAVAALHKGTYVEPSRQPLRDYLQGWLASERLRLRPGAYDACELHVRAYIVPRLGDVPLRDLNRPILRKFYADLRTSGRLRGRGGLSGKTVHNVHRTLSRALSEAVVDQLLVRNPAVSAHQQPPSPEQPTWSAAQLRAYFAAVAGDRLAAMWRVAATTGMRRGELVALRWSDVDLDRGRIAIARQRAKGAGTVATGPTKTSKARRLLPLDGRTTDALRRHRKEQDAERELWGEAYEDHGLVFCLANGRPLHPDAVTARMKRNARKAGLPWIKLHGLRHTYATLMLQAGVHPKVVQERLGHSSITVTMDTYSHAIPSMQEDAADRVADLLDGDDDTNEEAGEEQ